MLQASVERWQIAPAIRPWWNVPLPITGQDDLAIDPKIEDLGLALSYSAQSARAGEDRDRGAGVGDQGNRRIYPQANHSAMMPEPMAVAAKSIDPNPSATRRRLKVIPRPRSVRWRRLSP
jgi:hypothetical protein